MTDAEINRKIAEIVVPPPECDRIGGCLHELSKRPQWDGLATHCLCDDWEPRDFLHDWSATGMLLERPEFHTLKQHDISMFDAWFWENDWDRVAICNSDLQRAICLSFLKAHGVEVESCG